MASFNDRDDNNSPNVQPLEYIRELTLYLIDPDEELTTFTKEMLEKILMTFLSDNMHNHFSAWINMLVIAADDLIKIEKLIEAANFHMVRVCLYYVNPNNIIDVLYAMHKKVPVSLENACGLQLWGTTNLYFIKYIVISTLIMIGCCVDTPQLFQYDFDKRKNHLMTNHFIIKHCQASDGFRMHIVDLTKYYKIRKCLFDVVFLNRQHSILMNDILGLYKDSCLIHINMISRYLLHYPKRKQFLFKIPELQNELNNLINFVEETKPLKHDYFYFINETIPIPTPLDLPILMGVTLILHKEDGFSLNVELKNYLTVQQRLMIKRVVLMLRIYEQPDRNYGDSLKLDITNLHTVYDY